jgi:hypothetical protein
MGLNEVFCDHCGDDLPRENRNPISCLDHDVHSANKGESAVLCDSCWIIYCELVRKDKVVCKICGESTTENTKSSFFGFVHKYGPTDHKFEI